MSHPANSRPRLDVKRTSVFCVLLLAVVSACGGKKDTDLRADYPPLKSAEMGVMRNVYVAGRIWFGGVPSPEDLELAKRRGIESVIDLRPVPDSGRSELAARCRELRMTFLAVPIKQSLQTPPGTVDLVLSGLRASEHAPTLMYCESGAVSAMFFAIYRAVYEQVEVEAALIEARRAGMKPGQPEEFVLSQVERLTGWTLIADDAEAGSASDG